MILLVDIGNSRVKWALAEDGAIGAVAGFPRPREDAEAVFAREWHGLRPERVVCCSVAGDGPVAALQRWAERIGGARVHELRSTRAAGGITTAYGDPARLGADRWANLLGMRAAYGAVDALVVDAGTAVTVDALRADGQHPGGAIFAGLATSRDALRTAAPRLPAETVDGALPSADTAGAVGGGTLLALAGAIERVAREVGRDLDGPRCILTGGDGDRLQPLLGAPWGRDDRLTMRGLLAFAEVPCAG